MHLPIPTTNGNHGAYRFPDEIPLPDDFASLPSGELMALLVPVPEWRQSKINETIDRINQIAVDIEDVTARILGLNPKEVVGEFDYMNTDQRSLEALTAVEERGTLMLEHLDARLAELTAEANRAAAEKEVARQAKLSPEQKQLEILTKQRAEDREEISQLRMQMALLQRSQSRQPSNATASNQPQRDVPIMCGTSSYSPARGRGFALQSQPHSPGTTRLIVRGTAADGPPPMSAGVEAQGLSNRRIGPAAFSW